MATIDDPTFRELQASAGADFVRELVDTFLEEAPGLLAELRAAWQDGSAERFKRAAHSLKSNGQAFGADELANRARDLEHGGLPREPSALDRLQAIYEATASELQELARG